MSNSTPTYRCTESKLNRPHKCPGAQGRPTAATRLSPIDCREDSRTSYPRRNASGHRSARRRRVSTGPGHQAVLHPSPDHVARQLARIRVGVGERWAPRSMLVKVRVGNPERPASATRSNGLHLGCRYRCGAPPCVPPCAKPSLLLQLGWPQIPLVYHPVGQRESSV